MTKSVRIENADTSNHIVKVMVQEVDHLGVWSIIKAIELCNPTDMCTETIWKGKRIIIEEGT